ncbi:MAG: NAD-dependent dehydratase [Candidatus Doudnabacteria bacterium CG10_big_fil_rev_8_21_14_0_10_41_10]|uniref:UDP-glucuronate decarboxylase n=1 Tax=Candidatus Doudnabacteria bacterium CG10_big_fil_rev_8_21_14_0_10_41_10 TaxID=1974551 RepID=A0A2H0VCY9_9BACT|nr:MAG: NAD-dependent dehydratase [Candidatus Doudnabacteria bacterium CG10_big_fil_rev_8_21_14_0_10_41_10]
MKTILVTGGAGFIGSHLCDYLIAKGDKVICLDNLLTGSRENIKHLEKNENFKFVEHDIIEPLFSVIPDSIGDPGSRLRSNNNLDSGSPSVSHRGVRNDMGWGQEKLDQIYNLACPASPVHYQKNAIATIKTNTAGMINILELAKKNDATVLQASTSEIYGDPLVHPQKESYWGNVNTIGPRACYDEGKRVAETLCFDYHRAHGVDIRVPRIFNTYGPRMAKDDGRVVSNFILQALKGEDITIYGDGSQTRSFCFVTDEIEALWRFMNTEDFSGPMNIGNPEEFTMLELAKQVLELTGSRSKIIYKALPQDDPQQRQPDIALAREKLSWEPKVQLEEGLKKTIEYFKATL